MGDIEIINIDTSTNNQVSITTAYSNEKKYTHSCWFYPRKDFSSLFSH